uniref:Major facilitator superfamily (MFS) profile domain-containing protein n=1 Tax=Parascaris equorum TaxID=6256 RepID=A0A914R1E2_PAREQ
MVILAASATFIVGAVLCGAAPELWTLFSGRVLLGVAIGFASMIIPVYIGEVTPSHIRGTLITIYQLMVAFGFVVANAFAAWFAHYDPVNLGWRLMFSLAAVPAAIQVSTFVHPLLYEHNSETIDITAVQALSNQNSS